MLTEREKELIVGLLSNEMSNVRISLEAREGFATLHPDSVIENVIKESINFAKARITELQALIEKVKGL
jgi:hypothetical protein